MIYPASRFHTYSDDRLRQARQEVRARVSLAERCLEQALAREQQAERATASVRKYLARAKGDERLIAAILSERETLFEEEEGISSHLDKEDTGHSINIIPYPESSPSPCLSASPGSLRQRLFSRSAYR